MNEILKEVGMGENVLKIQETLEDLKQNGHAMTVAKANKNMKFSLNGINQFIHEGQELVLALGLFAELRKSKNNQQIPGVSFSKNFLDVYRPYRGEDLTNKSILINRTGGIGDILFTQPCLRKIKEMYPSCKIYFAVEPGLFFLIEKWTDILDGICKVPIDFEFFNSVDYHVIIEGVIERCREAEQMNCYKLYAKWMGLDIPDHELVPSLTCDPEYDQRVQQDMKNEGILKQPVMIQLKASAPIRTPQLHIWNSICYYLNQKNIPICFIDKPSLSEKIDKYIENLQLDNLYNLSKYSDNIQYFISAINQSRFIIAPDTSSLHISAGLGIPRLGIFGPFDARYRIETYPNSYWIQPDTDDFSICDYGGRCCFFHGHNPCPYNIQGTSPCFTRLDPKKIIQKIEYLIHDTQIG